MAFVAQRTELRGFARRKTGNYTRLDGLGASSAFDSIVADARIAITKLSAMAHLLRAGAADPQQENIGDQAIAFTDERAPRLLNEASQTQDAARLLKVQTAAAAIYKVVSEGVKDAAIDRFTSLATGNGILALAPASTRDAVKESALDFAKDNLNNPLQNLEKLIKVGFGVAGLFAVGYIWNTFRPRKNPGRPRHHARRKRWA